MSSDKRAIRTELLRRRRDRPVADRETADTALVAAVSALVAGAQTVAAYAPMAGEPGGAQLLPALLRAGCAVILPVLQPDLDLAWAAWPDGQLGPPGPAGVREPVGSSLDILAIARADLVLVPALAVDRDGVRLGRGGGSYDRALIRVIPSTPIVALVYDDEVVASLPADPHDIRVSHALTPSGLVALPGSPWAGTEWTKAAE